jgi:uncharacterized protein Veg
MVISKNNIWTHEARSIKKRVGHTKVKRKRKENKGRKKKRKDSHVLKKIYEGREIIQKKFPSTIYHPLYPYTCTS